MSGIRDRRRDPRTSRRSLRISLVLPVLIAALTLTALWGWAGSDLVGESLKLRSDADRAASVGAPTRELIAGLQDERTATAAWLAADDAESRDAVEEARAATDEATDRFRSARSELASGSSTLRSWAGRLDGSLTELDQRRTAVDAGELTGTETHRAFSDTVGEAIALLDAAHRSDDGALSHRAAAATDLIELAEAFSRQDALLYTAAEEGADQQAVAQAYAQALALQVQTRTALNIGDLPQNQADAFESLTETSQVAELIAVETPGEGGATALPSDADGWRESAESVGAELWQLSDDTFASANSQASSQASRMLLGAALGTLLALAALVAAGVLTARYVRSLLERIGALREAADEVSDVTLPQLVERMGREGQLEPPAAPAERSFGDDEIGRLAAALRRQRQRVVDTIVQQARGREGSETVFLGLARRTQILINRIIPKLDKLEREHQDSRLLKDIFAVDHLATRVRRHTENLLILGGAMPGRRWGEPVPIYEVIRSAISETEDYSRVEAPPVPRVALTGRAVADVVHLLAELIENGTSFSPPDTKVSVSAQTVAKGRVAVEIIDRGLGMSEAEYTRLNNLLADPPKLDMMTLGEAPRLGLFVVARLAKRHGLEVVLRSSPYGGTLAVVLLPHELLEEGSSILSGIMGDTAQATSEAGQTEVETTQALTMQHAADIDPPQPHRPIGGGLEPAPVPGEERPERAPAGIGASGLTRAPEEERTPALDDGHAYDGSHTYDEGHAFALDGGTLDTGHGVDGGHGLPGGQAVAPQHEPMAPLAEPHDVETEALPHPPTVYDDSGYPAYGGAGLLPSTPNTPNPPSTPNPPGPGGRSERPAPQSGSRGPAPRTAGGPAPSRVAAPRTESGLPTRGTAHGGAPIDKSVRTAEDMPRAHTDVTPPATEAPPRTIEATPQPGAGSGTPLKLPVRVRGERLAEQLRAEAHLRPGADDEALSRPLSPGRAGATMAAIQSGNKRARATQPAPPAEGHDPQAQPAGYEADAEGTARKDQR
ncbi:HAMP domain-containing protein [Streptomyces sp. 3MP-14]|uniref:histidine kinase n=1 Tax=Streptomyces mimosae TaxID=2586635 RepID=A0A5N5ZW27_9ACTN|nr:MULTISPECIES: nitrate- and nitrite sensing domain-containing protein [Streptomyces]KAB8159560.1 HAMP domain-containing protein [Streptomyces mimosae]KAB8172838.1 HAMP domain-containing protein [Streptomyces sp. 3MP-14]